MARRTKKEIQLTSYNELLGLEEVGDEKDKVIDVPLVELYSFKNHPFQVREDEEMLDLAESVGKYGVLNPALARPRSEGGYELVAGHRRKHASEVNGFSTMPVIIRDYTDDEAILAMIDSNIQRENILPSEKAFAYKMKLDAIRHQGAKSDSMEEAAALVGKEAGDSGRKVQRYIRLTLLIPELLELVDSGRIKVLSAVSLSFLTMEEQMWVLQCVLEQGTSITGSMAEKLKKETGKLTQLAVELILLGSKKESVKVTLSERQIREYFPKEYGKEQIERIIIELLEKWKLNEGRGE